ncbi:MAG: feruloyl-CoA synthase, partial [Hyphomonadaceae bacterium]|nr:feruloyl-CoA synthase [Hyphomonadaceae bacterium]
MDQRTAQGNPTAAPLRAIRYARPTVRREEARDGAILLGSESTLRPYDPNLARMFRAAAASAPDRVFLAERNGETWRSLTYADARRQVDAIACALLARGLSAERPVMALCANSIDHALLMLGCYSAGVPTAAISVAYSLQSQDHAKLKHINDLITPGLVYVNDTGPFAKALAAIRQGGAEVVANADGAGLGATPFAALVGTPVRGDLDSIVAAITPDTIAKFLFTSGSTGLPKGVINTHGMLASNQEMLAQVWPFLDEEPPVLVDWLPWSHTFGANHNFNLVMRHAGTLYIDDGRPLPALVGRTVRNLTEHPPTVYFNVPAGFAALLPFLERDEAFARAFFGKLRLIFYAGAALPQDVWARLEAVSIKATGERIPMTSSWGTTETSPLATSAHFITERAGNIGVPVPGVELKLVPAADRYEIRVRGPHITPGYWKRDDLTAPAFDEDGFYKPGDAVRFADPNDPNAGLIFAGRLAEDFKLTTGTWVHVGSVRIGLLAACSPALQDAIIAGADRDYIAILAWLNAAGCRTLIGDGAPAELAALARDEAVRAHVRKALIAWNAAHPGSSERIARAILLSDAPSIDANEITDKGYINQRLALERRRADVER